MPRIKDFSEGRKAAALQRQEPEKTDVIDPALENDNKPEKVEVPQDDASIAFQKQIDALRKSEQIAKDRAAQADQDREDAIKRANERGEEINRLKKDNVESRVETLSSALAAATAESEAAQQALEKAFELGDFKGQADATNRLSRANTSIANLENGKAQLEAEAKAAAEVKPVQENNDPLDNFNLPPLAKSWLRSHPEYLKVPRKNAMIQNLHYEVVDEGHEPYSQDYFESLEQHLGMREKPQIEEPEDDPVDPPVRNSRSSMVSAPVSREAPAGSSGERPGQVRLTAAQLEAAKIAGVTPKEYAEQVIKLRAEKLNGNYGGAP